MDGQKEATTLEKIAEGWYNYLQGSEYTKELMASRLKICDLCPYKKQMTGIGRVLMNATNMPENTFFCSKCNCPLGSKTAATKESCPIGQWGIAGTESMY